MRYDTQEKLQAFNHIAVTMLMNAAKELYPQHKIARMAVFGSQSHISMLTKVEIITVFETFNGKGFTRDGGIPVEVTNRFVLDAVRYHQLTAEGPLTEARLLAMIMEQVENNLANIEGATYG